MINLELLAEVFNRNYDNIKIHEDFAVGYGIIKTYAIEVPFSDGTACRLKYVKTSVKDRQYIMLDSKKFCYYQQIKEYHLSGPKKFYEDKHGLTFYRLFYPGIDPMTNQSVQRRVTMKGDGEPEYTTYEGFDKDEAEEAMMRFILENSL